MRRVLFLLTTVLTLAACGGDTADAPEAGTTAAGASTTDAPAADAPAADRPEPAATPGATPGLSGDDEAALASYTLTMERVEGWHRAVQNLQRLAEADPSLAELWDTEDADDESFGELIRRIEGEPRARRAIEEAGISPRDYVLTSLALLQAMFAQAAVEAGATLPEGINPANVEFVRQHQAELQGMFSDMGTEG